MTRYFSSVRVVFVAALALLPGCLCQGEREDSGSLELGKTHLEPLEARELTLAADFALDAPVGVTGAAPVVIVLAAERASCGLPKAQKRSFVLCYFGADDEPEKEVRAALTVVKKTYAAYVAKPPVTLVGRGRFGRVALEWARNEPTFFTDVLAEIPSSDLLPSSEFRAFADRGGHRFALVAERGAEADRLLASTRSAPAAFRLFAPGARSVNEAFAWLVGPPGLDVTVPVP